MTNHDIARLLEREQPEPPLFPADPERRERVEEAEAWGDEILQMTARRLALVAGGAGKLIDGGSEGRLGPLLFANPHVRRTAVKMFSRVFAASPRDEPALLAESRELLERVDSYIAEGVLGGDELNVADFTIAPSVALLAYHRELAAQIEDGPAGQMLDRVFAVSESRQASPSRRPERAPALASPPVCGRVGAHAEPSRSSRVRPLSTERGCSAMTSTPWRASSSRRLISSHCGGLPRRVRCRAKPPVSFSPCRTKTACPRSRASGQGTRPPCS